MGDYYGGRNVFYILHTHVQYICNIDAQVQAIRIPNIPTHTPRPLHVRTCVLSLSFSLSLYPSIYLSISFFPRLFTVHMGEDGRGIHHLAPHGRYTSNTLRVSQLTPSQTFHFVVQRARHGAHDGSHKWKPTPAGPRCYSLFLVSPHRSAPRWDAQRTGNRTARRAHRTRASRIRKIALIFARTPPSLCGRPRISDSASIN